MISFATVSVKLGSIDALSSIFLACFDQFKLL